MQFAPLYPILYRVLSPTFSTCLWGGEGTEQSIALTFDDGPHPDYTPPLLDVLERYQIKASFFWLGVWVDRSPALAKEVYQRGHSIGLHGYHHRSFPRLRPEELSQSLRQTKEAIARACQLNPDRLLYVRPPNGFFTPRILQQLQQENYRVVMWTIVPEDWVCPGVAIVIKRVMANLQPNALIVLHDGYYGGEAVTQITAELIPKLLQLGYHFITVDDCWQQKLSLKSSKLDIRRFLSPKN